MFCTACGAKVREGQGFCISCGARLAVPPSKPPEISRAVTPVKKSSLSTGAIVAIVAGGLIVLLGTAFAVTVPNLLKARLKAQTKSTMVDIRSIAIALENYITDNGRAPDQSGSIEGPRQFQQVLTPVYIQALPLKDQWGHSLLVYCGPACNGQYGISGANDIDYLIVSLGRDGIKENWEYNPNDPGAGLYAASSLSDFNRDLIWYSGAWVRAPQGYR